MISWLKTKVLILLTRIKFYSAIKGTNVIVKDTTLGPKCSLHHDVFVKNSKLANNVSIFNNCRINNSTFGGNNKIGVFCNINNITLGRFSYINDYSIVNNVTIGSFCSIGPSFKVGNGIHPTDFISTNPVFFTSNAGLGFSFSGEDTFVSYKQTTIGNDVWIGANVFINEGVKIGHGAILGAGTVITKDVPPYAIVVGVPGKIVKYRHDEKTIGFLLQSDWWNKSDEWLALNHDFFNKKIDNLTSIIFKNGKI